MSRHSFEPKIAAQVGLNAAVLYQNLTFWVEKNQANRRNLREGRYWTYNSIAAFAELFPYLTEKQIRTALDKLSNAGLILKGQFSDDRYDRTTWYTLGDPICPERRVDVAEAVTDGIAPEGEPVAAEGKSIRNRYKPDTKPYPPTSVGEKANLDFESVWENYPQDRRRNKEICHAHFKKAISHGVPPDDIRLAAFEYDKITQNYTRGKVKFSDNWFKNTEWKSFIVQANQQNEATRVAFEQSLERCKSWIISRHNMCQHITKPQISALLETGNITVEMLNSVGLET